jgi:hypothetical protein
LGFSCVFSLSKLFLLAVFFNPFTASCENAMSFSVPGVPAPCEKFPHSSQFNFEQRLIY